MIKQDTETDQISVIIIIFRILTHFDIFSPIMTVDTILIVVCLLILQVERMIFIYGIIADPDLVVSFGKIPLRFEDVQFVYGIDVIPVVPTEYIMRILADIFVVVL